MTGRIRIVAIDIGGPEGDFTAETEGVVHPDGSIEITRHHVSRNTIDLKSTKKSPGRRQPCAPSSKS